MASDLLNWGLLCLAGRGYSVGTSLGGLGGGILQPWISSLLKRDHKNYCRKQSREGTSCETSGLELHGTHPEAHQQTNPEARVPILRQRYG